MTDEELRIKVAELCGWKFQPHNRSWPNDYWIEPVTNVLRTFGELPDFPKDLNAMRDAENMLGDNKRDYVLNLSTHGAFDMHSACFATARQRCLAFVATMQPVKEEEKKDL